MTCHGFCAPSSISSGRGIPALLGEIPLNKVKGLESIKVDCEEQEYHSGNSSSCACTDHIGLPFRRTQLTTRRGGSWSLDKTWSPYHLPRPASVLCRGHFCIGADSTRGVNIHQLKYQAQQA
ncbi:hypothetical protein ElyMa_006843800 [Elysia marginata]|uniref:Uncharacterized protein n=1 Tax=Elysia marginata TaxID=1093978 RepID=A0AAV4J7L8_9GAST|nr:hypothetical protein ElyMa_006843800 [Elysia marginata]